MAAKARVRVEMKRIPADREEYLREVTILRKLFKRKLQEAGVLHDFKEHERFESESRRRRRKRKEAELLRLKEQRGKKKRKKDNKDDSEKSEA